MNRACDNCGHPFDAKKPWGRFCSSACRLTWNKAEHDREVIRKYLTEQARKGGRAKAAKYRKVS